MRSLAKAPLARQESVLTRGLRGSEAADLHSPLIEERNSVSFTMLLSRVA